MLSYGPNLDAILVRALEYFELKEVVRTGWRLRGVDSPESVADHSWGTAQLCMLFADAFAAEFGHDRADSLHAISMALVHDLAEVEVGDIPRRANPTEQEQAELESKAARERAAIDRLTSAAVDEGRSTYLGSIAGIRTLWDEYELGESPEARYVRDMNLIDMVLQAYRYEREGRYDPDSPSTHMPDFRRMDEFFATSQDRMSTSLGRELHARVRAWHDDIVG